jgi:phosphoglycolate phosphatase
MAQNLLIDLDGTLIDSSSSILASFAAALAALSIKPAVPLVPALIGPPIRQTLAKIAGSEDAKLIDRLFQHFRDDYDNLGYQRTLTYPGIDGALSGLSMVGKTLFIVTNKRIVPTMRILTMFGWVELFKEVYALDAGQVRFPSKADMVGHLIKEHAIDPADTLLIGDTAEDAEAACQNNIRFYGVAWGYGSLTQSKNMRILEKPADLLVL